MIINNYGYFKYVLKLKDNSNKKGEWLYHISGVKLEIWNLFIFLIQKTLRILSFICLFFFFLFSKLKVKFSSPLFEKLQPPNYPRDSVEHHLLRTLFWVSSLPVFYFQILSCLGKDHAKWNNNLSCYYLVQNIIWSTSIYCNSLSLRNVV